jgi:hypothetical protein
VRRYKIVKRALLTDEDGTDYDMRPEDPPVAAGFVEIEDADVWWVRADGRRVLTITHPSSLLDYGCLEEVATGAS